MVQLRSVSWASLGLPALGHWCGLNRSVCVIRIWPTQPCGDLWHSLSQPESGAAETTTSKPLGLASVLSMAGMGKDPHHPGPRAHSECCSPRSPPRHGAQDPAALAQVLSGAHQLRRDTGYSSVKQTHQLWKDARENSWCWNAAMDYRTGWPRPLKMETQHCFLPTTAAGSIASFPRRN